MAAAFSVAKGIVTKELFIFGLKKDKMQTLIPPELVLRNKKCLAWSAKFDLVNGSKSLSHP